MINDKNICLKVIEAILFANSDLVDEKILTKNISKNLKKFFEIKNNDWIPLEDIMKNKETDNFIKRSYTASHFSASLELAKAGVINIRQHAPFAPIYIKKKAVKK